MPEINEYASGTFCWPELVTGDRKGAKAFYGELFGWAHRDQEIDETHIYTMLTLREKNVGALYELNEEMRQRKVPPHWLSYISVASADATVARARDMGARIVKGPTDIFDVGRMALITDPAGATFAVWQPKQHIGAQIINEHGALTWNELMTNDVDKSGRFYTGVFGWTSETDQSDNPYTVFKNGERPVGGMMAISPDMGPIPPHWGVYFGTDDCTATAQKAESLGARTFVPPTDIPEVGRFAVFQDPQGAAFSVIQLLTPPA